MRRLAAVTLLVAAAALLVGCGSSELERRVTSLEGQVRSLEQRTAAAEGSITSTSRGLETATKAGTALESRLASTATKVSALEKQIESRNPVFTITAAAASNGAITPSGTTEAVAGSSKTFTIAPAANFHVQDVLVDGVSQEGVTTYTFSNVAANHAIQATFGPDSDPCQDCLSRLNRATASQFDAVEGIGDVKSQALVDGQPFAVSTCSVDDIEAAVDAVAGIGDVLRENIVRHFCPDLYGD